MSSARRINYSSELKLYIYIYTPENYIFRSIRGSYEFPHLSVSFRIQRSRRSGLDHDTQRYVILYSHQLSCSSLELHSHSSFSALRSLAAVVTVMLATSSALFNLLLSIEQDSFQRAVTVTSRPKEVINVMFGLSGNHSGFLAEFEAALKSVLLNGPVSADLAVYVLADGNAYAALPNVFNKTGLEHSIWRDQVSITVYNVDLFLKNWSATVASVLHVEADRGLHTVGAYFRLFGHEVLPKSVKHVIYLDTDAVVTTNLAELWHSKDEDAAFMLGSDGCDGFMILNLYKGSRIWELAATIDFRAMRKVFSNHNLDDQLIFRAIHHTYPAEATLLPDEWSISVANGAWRYAKTLVEARPAVGMLHFNGGGASKDAYFEKGLPVKFPDTWGISRYCKFIQEETYPSDRPLVINFCRNCLFHSFTDAKLPWTWALLIGQSMREGDGVPLKIEWH